jgi:hypothetical protein
VVTTYVGGAVAGGVLADRTSLGAELLLLPCAALLALVAAERR